MTVMERGNQAEDRVCGKTVWWQCARPVQGTVRLLGWSGASLGESSGR